jgi:DNA topoisomerase VI subunit A
LSHFQFIAICIQYYCFQEYFGGSEQACSETIAACEELLGEERLAFGVVAAPNGFIGGHIVIKRNDEIVFDGNKNPWQLYPIDDDWLDPLVELEVEADDDVTEVLVTEAHCFLYGLKQRMARKKRKCIFMTGQGFPSRAAQACLHRISTQLERLRVHGMFDSNPHGLHILCKYQQGISVRSDPSKKTQKRYGVNITWMGLRPSQLKYLKVDIKKKGVPLDEYDRGLREKILEHCRGDARMTKEALAMFDTNMKIDLEKCCGMSKLFHFFLRVLKHEKNKTSSAAQDGEEMSKESVFDAI